MTSICSTPCTCFDALLNSPKDRLTAFLRRFRLFRADSSILTSRSWLGRLEYWDAAYASGRYHEEYEWNQTPEVCWPFIMKMLGDNHSCKVLHVGCGNSSLSRQLHDAGFTDLTNVDYSEVVIKMMQNREPALKWLCADCCEPGVLGNEVYDFCIDKGAIDSLFESGTEHMKERGIAMVEEIHRSLKPGGQYLIVSNGGVGNEALKAVFSSVESEVIEGYCCDLYYKLVLIVLCRK
eukprot:TRINITY_DN24257_c0_g1_i1.p1 TRINITY_DN24257_c0_g1~~TRINITY_DN24257_c0_g1_i1.p1  ORF type:complete len:236 (+),score=32.56 TRINITY_DN24257_c0_g1_i1:70-777(+)